MSLRPASNLLKHNEEQVPAVILKEFAAFEALRDLEGLPAAVEAERVKNMIPVEANLLKECLAKVSNAVEGALADDDLVEAVLVVKLDLEVPLARDEDVLVEDQLEVVILARRVEDDALLVEAVVAPEVAKSPCRDSIEDRLLVEAHA